MAELNNQSAMRLSLVLIFSLFLIVNVAESVQLPARSVASAKPRSALKCANVIAQTAGQTCSGISQQFNLSLRDFLNINPNLNCDKIFVGEWLCVQAA